MSIKSTQIKLNHPNKVLSAVVSKITGVEYWPFANGAEDQWYLGSTSPRFYRWEVELNIIAQDHGSHLTREAFTYNGLDVLVGDWIAGATDGRCLKIISVKSKTATTAVVIAEDWLRYNTFKNTTGNGIFNTGPAVIFSLNENGYPMLDPLPSVAGESFYAVVMSRFQYMNPQLNFVLEQPNHNFTKGDVISATANGFVRADVTTAGKMIGVVTESGPGPNYFIVLPNNRIIDMDPDVPGQQGDYIYLDPATGRLTNEDVPDSRVMYLCVRSAVPTVLTGALANPTLPNGYSISINGVPVTFNGAGGFTSLPEMVTQINAISGTTEVVASSVTVPSSASSSATGTAYGLVGGYTPFSAWFNNGHGSIEVTFTTNGSRYPGVATPEDMAIDINATGIPNLVAEATVDILTIKDLSGNSISISNGVPDTGGNYFVGPGNISGLPAVIPASTGSSLRLTREDGGEVFIYDQLQTFQNNTGVTSGHTGSMPLAMYIERGIRTGGITLVPNIAARDNLQPAAGDMVYVTDKGDGEWGLYLYTGSNWVITGTQDSATVDAKTLIAEYSLPIAGDPSEMTLGNISVGRKITTISVEVVDALTGHSSTPTITVGTDVDQALFLDENNSDLTDPSTYFNFPEYIYESAGMSDLVIKSWLTHHGATSGNVIVKVTYV